MKVDVSHPEKHVALLHIEVDAEQIGRVRESVYRRLVRRYSIPGFRKGKAPPFILENYLGREAFDREVLDDLLDESYREALDQAGVIPVSPPEVDLKTWERGAPLVYEARLTTKPDVALGRYTGLEIPKEEPVVTEEQVAAEIEAWRQRLAQPVEAPEDAPLGEGSLATIDFAGFCGDQPLEGATAEDYPLEIGRGGHIPGFEEQLVGLKVGDRHDVKVTFAADADEKVAGKEVTFKVSVKEHRQRRLPEIDDDFARSLAPALGIKLEADQAYGLVQLKEELQRRLQAAADRRAQAAFAARVVKRVVDEAEVDVPEVMLDTRVAALREDFAGTLRQRGLTLEGYLSASGETEESLTRELRERAEGEVRRDLVIEAVARKEGVTATDQEVDERIAGLARMLGQDPVEFRAAMEADRRIERVREEVIERKTVDFLVQAQVPVEDRAGEAAAPENRTQPADVGINQSREETPRESET